MIHELKVSPEYFKAVISGKKTFEIRKNDRPFHIGDLLALNEFDGQYWTGNSCLVYADYILNNPDYVKKDMIIVGIMPCYVLRYTEPFKPTTLTKDYTIPFAPKVGMNVHGEITMEATNEGLSAPEIIRLVELKKKDTVEQLINPQNVIIVKD